MPDATSLFGDAIGLLIFGGMFAWMLLDNHRANKAVEECCKQLEAVNQAMLDQLASQDQEFRQFLKDIKEKMNDPA
ncbi:hypothetical protein [Microcystis phage Mae-JY24]